jgi:uncharacterized RDD family membrane protein YckC
MHMTCSYCRYLNLDGEHRCRRCGRPLADTYAMATRGNLATVPQAAPVHAPAAAPPPGPPRQARLFQDRPSSKVVPIVGEPPARPKPKPVTHAGTRVAARRAPNEAQPSLDFLPPAPPAPRKLGTTVEAVIYCDAPVATPMHRALAGAIDCSMILIAFCLFLVAFRLLGGVASGKYMFLIWAAAAGLIAMFYGFVWVYSGGPTFGMRATGLTLINFDGYSPDAGARWLRYLGACLSCCAGGLGILWALVDEESLAWHDHISKTFPTFRVPETNFVRHR